ncbi:MAG: hypothetical protein JNL32_06380 [Candidatus Kapabacteria bacterium]|nr:hypothetical protein [Candidatus Kapabacteria bacterium]
MKHILHVILLVCLVMYLNSCKGNTGPVGPAGNANVQSMTIAQQTFTDDGLGGFQVALQTPMLTQAVLSSGAVLVYMQAIAVPGSWVALPTSVGGFNYNVVISQGLVSVYVNQLPASAFNFRVVIIPKAAAIKSNPANYEDVAKEFNLANN